MVKTNIMSLADFRKTKTKPSKYHSEKSGGYDSVREHERGNVLELLEKRGIISNLRKQVRYVLIPAQYVVGIKGKLVCARRECSYIADFVYVIKGDYLDTVEDSKGCRTNAYKHKKRLMLLIHGITIKET